MSENAATTEALTCQCPGLGQPSHFRTVCGEPTHPDAHFPFDALPVFCAACMTGACQAGRLAAAAERDQSARVNAIVRELRCECEPPDFSCGDSGQRQECPHHGDGDPSNVLAQLLYLGWTVAAPGAAPSLLEGLTE